MSLFQRRRLLQAFLLALCVLVPLYTFVGTGSGPSVLLATRNSLHMRSMHNQMESGARPPTTLVIYTFSNTDEEYFRNLQYFVKHGMWEGDGCEYVMILQQGEDIGEIPELPQLPSNARYVYHVNRCFDWGTFGWAMSQTAIQNIEKYLFIVFMNSSVRGPFLPQYWPHAIHWSTVFTSKITDEVKLVGATISCEGTPLMDDGTVWRQNPHVQSYIMATDQVGLKVLRDNGNVFECFEKIRETIYHSELGSSLAILEAGYNLDSMMMRYNGIDWRNKSSWSCNGGMNPYLDHTYDGIDMNPLEVLFIKVKATYLMSEYVAATWASVYDRWSSKVEDPESVKRNEYLERQAEFKRQRTFNVQMKPNASICFDAAYYLLKNPELPQGWAHKDAWKHFVNHGQHENRPFRYKDGCMPRSSRNLLQDLAVSEHAQI